MRKSFLSLVLLIGFSRCPERQTPVQPVDPHAFTIVGACAVTGYAEDLAVADSAVVYIAAGQAGIEVITVANPQRPERIGFADPIGGKNIVRVAVVPESNLLLSVESAKKVDFWDISRRNSPAWVTAHMSDRTEGIWVWGAGHTGSADRIIIFAADRDDGLKVNGFYWGWDPFYSGQTWWAIESIGLEMPVRGWPQQLVVIDSIIVMACDQVGVDLFRIVDVESQNIIHLQNVDTPGSARCVARRDTLIYVADGNQGIAVLGGDTENGFVYRRSITTPGYAQWVTIYQDHLILADGAKGVQLYDLSKPDRPRLTGRLDLPYAQVVKTDGDYLYVVDRYQGLLLLTLR